jgi:hypothetical protein
MPWDEKPMSKIEKIESAVKGLSADELSVFRAWFAEFDADAWDRQFEADVKGWEAGCRGGVRPA